MWYIYTLLAAAFKSASEIINKKVVEKEGSIELLLHIYIFVFLLGFLMPVNFEVNIDVLMMILIRSLAFSVAIFLLMKAYHHLEISVVSPLMNLSPLFLLVLSSIFAPEEIGFISILGIFLIIVGTYLLEIHSNYLDFKNHLVEFTNKYFIYVFFALVLISVSAIYTKKIMVVTDIYTFYFYTNLFIMLFFAVFYAKNKLSVKRRRNKEMEKFVIDYKKDLLWILSSAVFTATFIILYFKAVNYPGAMITLIIPLLRMSTLGTVIFGGRMFHEKYLVNKIIATIVLIIGSTLIIMG